MPGASSFCPDLACMPEQRAAMVGGAVVKVPLEAAVVQTHVYAEAP